MENTNPYQSPASELNLNASASDDNSGSIWWVITLVISTIYLIIGSISFVYISTRVYERAIVGQSIGIQLFLLVLTLIIYIIPWIGVVLKKEWGLKMGLTIAVISMINIPLGTLLGFLLYKGLTNNGHRFNLLDD